MPPDTPMEERLQKVLARAGITSRRGAEKLIEEGRVSVNGRVVREMGLKVDPVKDEIRVDTVAVPRAAAAGDRRCTYLLLNKPKGVLCTVRDDRGRTTVLDLVPPFPGKRLFPVGRLDEDSDGIVILTNDGELTQRLTHPSFGVPKTYDVRVKGRLTPEEAEKFQGGVWLSEGRTARSRVQIRRAGPRVTHVAVTLTEGRNREIRRAFAKIGFPVLSLRRIQIGPVVSRGLKPGQFRPLDPEEVTALQELAERGSEGRVRPMRRRTQAPGTKPRRRSGKPDPAKAAKKKSRRHSSDPRKGSAGKTGPGRGGQGRSGQGRGGAAGKKRGGGSAGPGRKR
jgi:23S rRNA pseudouridine2605 synthase